MSDRNRKFPPTVTKKSVATLRPYRSMPRSRKSCLVVGRAVGVALEGVGVGKIGAIDGDDDGVTVGAKDGVRDGIVVGVKDGITEGISDGVEEIFKVAI